MLGYIFQLDFLILLIISFAEFINQKFLPFENVCTGRDENKKNSALLLYFKSSLNCSLRYKLLLLNASYMFFL